MSSSKVVVNSVSEIIAAFQLFDKNQDGQITHSEVVDLIKTLGGDISSDPIQNLLKCVDKKGGINCAQFMKFWKDVNGFNALENEEIKKAFKQYDIDGDGFITKEEMMSIMSSADEEAIEECLASIDINGDGRISYVEFLAKWRFT